MPTTHTTNSTATTATATTERSTGQRVQLATYTTRDSNEPRVLIGQRVDGIVRVTDEPVHGTGRRYLVEAQLESKAALDALVSDYLEKARRIGYAPMHGWF